jgi:hypothetical protein
LLNINLQKLQLLIPWDLGDYNIQTSKFFVFWVFFSVNFFTPKLMKIRWSSLFLGPFAPHFQIKLSIHVSNFNFRFVSMSELELFLFMGVLTPNFNTMDLVKILEKKSKTKKVKNQDFMGKTNYFLRTLPFSPWAVSATWLHVGAP